MSPPTTDFDTITLGMSREGGRVVQALLGDPVFMAKVNAAGEMAARVFVAMCREQQRRMTDWQPIATAPFNDEGETGARQRREEMSS